MMKIIWKIECKWCNYWFLYHSCHIFTYSYLKRWREKKNYIIFHDQFSWRFSRPVTWMRVHLYAVPLCFLSMTEISHVFSAARFSVVFLKETTKKKQQTLSLAYLKIVIRDKGKLLSLPFVQTKCGVAGLDCGQFVCCLKNTLPPFSLSLFHPGLVRLSCQRSPPSQLPLSHPDDLSCLTFCSTCSNCGASWIVLLTLQGLRYLSLRYITEIHIPVSEPGRWRVSSEKQPFISDVDVWLFVFLCQQMRTNLTEVYFSRDILDVKFLYDGDVFKTCNNIGANMSCRRRVTSSTLKHWIIFKYPKWVKFKKQ